MAEDCHLALPANIRQYLNARGISDDNYWTLYKLGWGNFYGNGGLQYQYPMFPALTSFSNCAKTQTPEAIR